MNILLQQYSANVGANWKCKDAAITLVLALSAKGKTRSHGATSINTLVNIGEFFSTHIAPGDSGWRYQRDAYREGHCCKVPGHVQIRPPGR